MRHSQPLEKSWHILAAPHGDLHRRNFITKNLREHPHDFGAGIACSGLAHDILQSFETTINLWTFNRTLASTEWFTGRILVEPLMPVKHKIIFGTLLLRN